tara:strand:+ start:3540 stop:3809 length:270 start_codon:yes stop_codon:yes gene_type:complete
VNQGERAGKYTIITWHTLNKAPKNTTPLEVLSDALSIIRTVTVGSGVTPDLLTLKERLLLGARGLRNKFLTAGGELHPAPRTKSDKSDW